VLGEGSRELGMRQELRGAALRHQSNEKYQITRVRQRQCSGGAGEATQLQVKITSAQGVGVTDVRGSEADGGERLEGERHP